MSYAPDHLTTQLQQLIGDPYDSPLNGAELDFAEAYVAGDNTPTLASVTDELDLAVTHDQTAEQLATTTRAHHNRAQEILQNHNAL